MFPTRRELGAVWRKLEALCSDQPLALSVDEVVRPIIPGMIPGKLCVCMRIFQEVGLLRATFEQDIYRAEVVPGHGKANLEDSALLRYLKHL